MQRRLNSAQRLWALGAAVFLATTIAVIAAAWPARDPAIVSDLGKPECQAAMDVGTFRQTPGPACQSLQSFEYKERVAFGSVEEYDRYLWRSRARIALLCLATWAVLSVGFYLLGWSSATAVNVLLRRGDAKGG